MYKFSFRCFTDQIEMYSYNSKCNYLNLILHFTLRCVTDASNDFIFFVNSFLFGRVVLRHATAVITKTHYDDMWSIGVNIITSPKHFP